MIIKITSIELYVNKSSSITGKMLYKVTIEFNSALHNSSIIHNTAALNNYMVIVLCIAWNAHDNIKINYSKHCHW